MCRRRSSVPSDDRREIRCGASEIPRNQGNIRNATVILVTDVPSWSSSPIRPLSLASPSLSTLSVTWVDVFLSLSLSLALGPFSSELRPPERVLGLSLFDQLTSNRQFFRFSALN